MALESQRFRWWCIKWLALGRARPDNSKLKTLRTHRVAHIWLWLLLELTTIRCVLIYLSCTLWDAWGRGLQRLEVWVAPRKWWCYLHDQGQQIPHLTTLAPSHEDPWSFVTVSRLSTHKSWFFRFWSSFWVQLQLIRIKIELPKVGATRSVIQRYFIINF